MDLKYFFLQVSMVLMVFIFEKNVLCDEDRSHYTCAQLGQQCNMYRQRPCCHTNNVCEEIDGTFVCIKKATLGQSCNVTSECKTIKFSECLNSKCVCTLNTMVVDSQHCQPVLNFGCRKNEDCKVENSACIDYKCQCTSNYSSKGDKCVAKYLGEKCNDNSGCIDIEFAECFNGRCQCRKSYTKKNIASCVPENKLGKSCKSNLDCSIDNNQQCTNHTCVCEKFATFVDGICKPILNGKCADNTQCEFRGFHCVDNKCQCKPNFIPVSSHQCVDKEIVSSCDFSYECSDPWHARCVENKCMCNYNHVAINNFTCYPILGGYCWSQHQCLTHNSDCIDYHCQCKENFVKLADNFCGRPKFVV